MSLQKLPFDVLHQIWQLVSPYDFEACAKTCKFLYTTAKPLLPRHNALRKQYRSFRLPERNGLTGNTSLEPYTLPQLLCDIAVDPIIAEYILHLDLENRESLNLVYEEESDWEAVVRAKLEAHSDALLQLMCKSPYFAQLNIPESKIKDWFNCILMESADFEDGQSIDFAAAFLLSLLPNLESLALSRDWLAVTVRPDPDGEDVYYSEEEDEDEDEDEINAVLLAKKTAPLVRKFIHYMVEQANREDLTGQPLSKLHTLRPIRGVDTQFGDNLVSIFPFLTLKSLRRVFHDFGTLDVSDFPSAENNVDSSEDSEEDNENDSDEESEEEGDDDDEASNEEDDDGASENEQEADSEDEAQEDDEDEEDDNVDDEWRSAENGPRQYDALGATVELMALDHCIISPGACQPFFSNMERLTVLQYRHHTMESFGQEWDADEFLQALASTPAAPSLEKLAILAGMVWDDGSPIRSPLHGFQSLQHLEVDGVFFGHNPDWEEAAPALHSLLPPSLRVFVLHISTENYECVEDLFSAFKDEREKCFPLLERVELRVRHVDFMGCPVEEHEERLAKLKSIADVHGLTVTVVSEEEHSSHSM
ncbi:hypothetical protein VHEMI00850 [[Torrubiella] hemipterigena]|uniref:F-box domain-containing protein n=1 Tax=[Torrubiella] hemipterigena TaxID=1531966 RepID=A0A0A1T5T0_9HYPO|nr:hypothetical protein VHEMI00850 [[Torrubiella] hemipterigena]